MRTITVEINDTPGEVQTVMIAQCKGCNQLEMVTWSDLMSDKWRVNNAWGKLMQGAGNVVQGNWYHRDCPSHE